MKDSRGGKMVSRKDDPKAAAGGELDQSGREMALRGELEGFFLCERLIMKIRSSSSSLPPAPAGGGGAAASSISAAGLVLAQFRLCLLAAVAAVVVEMVLLVEGYRSRHGAGRCRYEP